MLNQDVTYFTVTCYTWVKCGHYIDLVTIGHHVVLFMHVAIYYKDIFPGNSSVF